MGDALLVIHTYIKVTKPLNSTNAVLNPSPIDSNYEPFI